MNPGARQRFFVFFPCDIAKFGAADALLLAPSPWGEGWGGLMKSWGCTPCAFMPISLRGFFPPLRRGGQGGCIRPVVRAMYQLLVSKLGTPPDPPFARGGKGSVARAVIRSRATKTRVSKPSLQYGKHHLFISPGLG